MRAPEITTTTGRRRPRIELSQVAKAYRLHFFYEPLGRYFRSSKRRLYWSFGFTDMNAVRAGKMGEDCRGDEHEVELVWSLKSGKTRIYWNRRNISNLFSQDPSVETVDKSWTAPSGETLHIVAHAEATPGVAQYDLLIDGVSFATMSSLADVGKADSSADTPEYEEQIEVSVSDPQGFQTRDEQSESEEDCDSHSKPRSIICNSERLGSGGSREQFGSGGSRLGSNNGSEIDSFQSLTEHSCNDGGMGFRLAMVGLSSRLAEVDELHSELYSTILESLRHRIVEYLPQTEGMVSRSIIQTFFPDYVSQQSEDILSTISRSSEEKDPQQIEVDALFGAFEWAVLHSGGFASSMAQLNRPAHVRTRQHTWSPGYPSEPRYDPYETGLDYMQKLIDSVFIKVRNEDISSDEGARILLGVAAVLNLDFAGSIPRDTVLMENLDPNTTTEDLRVALSEYGDIEAVAISSRCPTFAFCRFMDEYGCDRFIEEFDVDRLGKGVQPRVILLTEHMQGTFRDPEAGESSKTEEKRSRASPTPPPSDSSASPFTIPHLMGAWTEDGDDNSTVEATPSYYEIGPNKIPLNMSPRSAIMGFESLDDHDGLYSV